MKQINIKELKTFLQKERKLFILFFVFIFSFILISFLSDKYLIEVPASGGNIDEIVISSNVRYINPVIASTRAEKDLLPLIYSPILKRGKNNNIVSNIADVSVYDDKKTYLLKIKKNIHFSDGTLLTADDIIFTIKKIQDPLLKSPLQTEFLNLQYNKIDDFNLELKLKKEYAQFEDTLTHLYVLPKKQWIKVNPEIFHLSSLNLHPIGSGPFVINKISLLPTGQVSKITLNQNKFFFKDKRPYLDSINFLFFQNIEDYKNSLEYSNKNNIKNISGISKININEIANKTVYDQYSVNLLSTAKIYALFFKNDNVFLKNNDLKQLIINNIDNEKITNQVFGNFAKPVNGIYTDAKKNDNKKIDNEQIIKNLEKNGWSLKNNILYDDKQKTVTLNLTIVNSDEIKLLANEIKKSLKKIGIQIKIVSLNPNVFLDSAIRERKFDILLSGYQTSLSKQNLFQLFHSSQIFDPGLNILSVDDKKIDKLIEKLRLIITNEEREKILSELNEKILEKKVFVPLYNPYYTYITDYRLKGFDTKIANEQQNRFDNIQYWYVKTAKKFPQFLSKIPFVKN